MCGKYLRTLDFQHRLETGTVYHIFRSILCTQCTLVHRAEFRPTIKSFP